MVRSESPLRLPGQIVLMGVFTRGGSKVPGSERDDRETKVVSSERPHHLNRGTHDGDENVSLESRLKVVSDGRPKSSITR